VSFVSFLVITGVAESGMIAEGVETCEVENNGEFT
jgi:hypothetical protein